jgi:hypothetical protein
VRSSLDVERLGGDPELLVADLADGPGLGLDRVLVLAEQLDRVLHAAAQVDGARPGGAAGELRELETRGQQVEAIGRRVAVDVAAVLERRDDGAQLGLGGNAERGEAVVVAQELQLALALDDLDGAGVERGLDVTLDERDGLIEQRLIHRLERGASQRDAGFETGAAGAAWAGRRPWRCSARRSTGSSASDRR